MNAVKSGRVENGRVKDRGSATIWGVALMGLVFMAGMSFAFVGAAEVARHRAQSAADLSVLVAARWAFADPLGACARAAELAKANGAVLVGCAITGPGAEVEASVNFTLPGLGARSAHARARAGPVRMDAG